MAECATASGYTLGENSMMSNPLLHGAGTSAEGGNDTPGLGAHRRQSAGVGVPLHHHDAGSVGFPGNKPFAVPDIPMGVFPLSCIDEYNDPLAYLLSNGPTDVDPSGFGLGSVPDATLGERPRTAEELRLFRSQKLLQAEAASVALNPLHHENRQLIRQIGTELAREIRRTVREHANASSGLVPHLGQQDLIDSVRQSCHRMIAGCLDAARSALSKISESMGCGSFDAMDGQGMVQRSGLRRVVGPAPSQQAMEPQQVSC